MSTVGVYIGRFQPFHNGHKSVVDRMLAENDDTIILLGGAGGARSATNPFSSQERDRMICADYKERPFIIWEIVDYPESDDLWADEVKSLVHTGLDYGGKPPSVRLYGAYSDQSSFYLDMFPEWEARLTKLEGYQVHATTIRLWLRNRDWIHIKQNVPPGTFEYLKKLVEEEPDTCHRWLRWSDERFG